MYRLDSLAMVFGHVLPSHTDSCLVPNSNKHLPGILWNLEWVRYSISMGTNRSYGQHTNKSILIVRFDEIITKFEFSIQQFSAFHRHRIISKTNERKIADSIHRIKSTVSKWLTWWSATIFLYFASNWHGRPSKQRLLIVWTFDNRWWIVPMVPMMQSLQLTNVDTSYGTKLLKINCEIDRPLLSNRIFYIHLIVILRTNRPM